ncbi:MAG: hypothetical protein NMNS01_21930 [Nitrosomonas sp.]|nr:MAG: hypothetical protein NMNS01_21930 [Nitrosomonas sp.]
MKKVRLQNTSIVLIVVSLILFSCGSNGDLRGGSPRLLDISGLAWIQDNTFLAVSDAKNSDEKEFTRVSLLGLPDSLSGINFNAMKPQFPGGLSNDLESAAGIPGTNKVLLVESANNNGAYQRIFLADVGENSVAIKETVTWTDFTSVFNVEGSAVADAHSGLIFIWAERNTQQQSTEVKWTDLQLEPFAIGQSGHVNSVTFTLPADLIDQNGDPLYNRPIVGLDVDSAGNLYSVASFDPEGLVPDPDIGPFRSIVFKIGQVVADDVVLDEEPATMSILDSLKVESVAIRENGHGVEIFVGTDDENYGGILRQLPPP